MAIVVTSSSELSSSHIHSNDIVPIKLSVRMASNNTTSMAMTSHDHVNGHTLSPPSLRHMHDHISPQVSVDHPKCTVVHALDANSSTFQRDTVACVAGSTRLNVDCQDIADTAWPQPIESPPSESWSRDDSRDEIVTGDLSDLCGRSNSRSGIPLQASAATMTSLSSQQTTRESAAGIPSPNNSPLDLAECQSVQRRVPARSSMQGCWPRRTPYPRLVHPLDKGLFLSFTVSIIYLAAAVVAVCPSICIVVIVLPIAVLARRGIIRCATAIAASETQQPGGLSASAARSPPTDSAPTHATINQHRKTDEEVFGDDDIDTEVRTPLTGHEEFWLGQRSAVTQCLVSFDGHLDVDQLRQLVEMRLLNNKTMSFDGPPGELRYFNIYS